MFNATETRKMYKSAIQAQSAFFRKDYHLSAVVLFFARRGGQNTFLFCSFKARQESGFNQTSNS